jgi:NAD(P)-dependent dehydrogenase (short-subunit alcohol dehydrogenase family)
MENLFSLSGKSVVVTGGAGVLGVEIAKSLAAEGAKVSILDVDFKSAESVAQQLEAQGHNSYAVYGNVMDVSVLKDAAEKIIDKYKKIDILINGAGGNNPKATTGPEMSFFDLPQESLKWVMDLNLMGSVLPSQVFGRYMAEEKQGIILNISSMNALRPLTKIPAYSAAKAAVTNFTQWLAVHMAQEYSVDIRVNAIAPGFFLTKQNEFLLLEKDTGQLTKRGKQIIDHTPMQRFGEPQDLIGTILWLLSPASKFVTGIVVPVDGGFSAYSGV